MAAAKPIPFSDATNKAEDMGMKDKLIRKHTKFDEEGNPCEIVETEIKEPVAAVQEHQAAASEVEEGQEVAEEGEGEEEAVEANDEEEAKLAYRNVPSLFNTEKERTAKWEGKHIRFPEDDEGDDEDATTAPVSAELEAKIDELGSAVATAMVVDQKN